MSKDIPDIVIGRLPVYLRTLSYLARESQKATASSQELGQRLGISSAQIRKDLSHFGEFGKQGTGYHINYLIEQLREILNLKDEWQVAVIGAGHLGHALANYNGFQHRGFRITAVFDNDPAKIGGMIGGLTVQPITDLKGTLEKAGIHVAILAVPPAAAQEIADLLVTAGIKAILNYAPINLRVPKPVRVQHNDPVIELQRMTFYLEHN